MNARNSGLEGDARNLPVVDYRGQTYRLIRIDPYTRKDGVETTIAIWSSRCHRCGQPFECTTSSNPTRFKPPRRCQECRRRSRWGPAARIVEKASAPCLPGQREFVPIGVYEQELNR